MTLTHRPTVGLRVTVVVLALLIAVVAVSGCGDQGPERTSTADEALAEVRSALSGGEEALGLPLRSEAPTGPMLVECTDPVDGGPPGRVYWSAYYKAAEQAPTAPTNLPSLDKIVPRMQALGWTLSADRRSIPGAPEVIFARPSTVDIKMSIAGDPGIGLDVNVDTSCVWPNGVRP